MRSGIGNVARGAVLFAALGLWAPPLQCAPSDPFDSLESALRKTIAERARAPQTPETRPGDPLLLADRTHLHDIRNHRTFSELWQQWDWKKNEIRVLYIGSGGHLAPLEFLHGGRALQKATFTCTEIDPLAAARMDTLLRIFQDRKIYSDLTVDIRPSGGPEILSEWARLRSTPRGRRLASDAPAFLDWLHGITPGTGPPPSFESVFRFRHGATRVEVRLLVRETDSESGSTPAYRARDLGAADLVITHDWDHTPRGNLALLLDILESHAKVAGAKPLAVMMEDLGSYLFPVDLSAFNPVARSSRGYGHQAYVVATDGTRLDAEDGENLYTGGVILQPDTRYFSSISQESRTAFFNLLFFGRHLFGWRNVDLFGGRRVPAPALLDLGVKYAFRDIRGSDLTLQPRFPAQLAEEALSLLDPRNPMPPKVRGPFCDALADYEASLARAGTPPAPDLFSESRRELAENPFMSNPKARAKLEQFLNERPRFEALLASLQSSYREALRILSQARPQTDAACGAARQT